MPKKINYSEPASYGIDKVPGMVNLMRGDSLALTRRWMPDNSVDTIITDPPYDLKFMGLTWDNGLPGIEYWGEFLRVTKPGGFLLAFGSPRTNHRLVTLIENAGWEIRDTIYWIHGEGFPKALDLGKKSEKFHGYKTGLKPAVEPIVLAMKPMEGGFFENMLKWGTGALNIDDTRIDSKGEVIPINKLDRWSGFGQEKQPGYQKTINTKGRYPANVILDEEAGALLDKQSKPKMHSAGKECEGGRWGNSAPNAMFPLKSGARYGDSGGASRFFYSAKTKRQEAEVGLRGRLPCVGCGGKNTFTHLDKDDKKILCWRNDHPTIKPLSLMRYLCMLTRVPEGGIVYDPFMGSGSTGVAALQTGRCFIGAENEVPSFAISHARIYNEFEAIQILGYQYFLQKDKVF